MTKKFLLNKFMKKTIHTFTLTLAISAFSCDMPENNTNNQENKEIPAIKTNAPFRVSISLFISSRIS